MKLIITESRLKQMMLFKQINDMNLKPNVVPCIGGTECTDLVDEFGETIFRIDMSNDCFYNGTVLHDYLEHLEIPLAEFRIMLKAYLKQEFGYNIKNMM